MLDPQMSDDCGWVLKTKRIQRDSDESDRENAACYVDVSADPPLAMYVVVVASP